MTFSKLGTDIQTGHIVELPQAARRQGLYIIGANGTGKTGLIENLILQDIDQGLGVGLLDPHGDLTNAILSKMTKRLDDVILLDITDKEYPFGLNLFECHDPTDSIAVQKIVDLVMHIFEKLFDVSRVGTPLLLDYLRNCTYVLVANPGYTMADIPLLFADQSCRQKLLATITDPYVKLFWQQYEQLPLKDQREEAASTMRRVREFLQPLSRTIVGQAKTTVDMFRVMDERKILLVKLSAQLDQVTSLIGSVIIALFLNAAYSRAALPVNKRKQFNLYADEFLSTPIDYLLSGKTHANPVVNMFINKWDVRKLVLDSSAINKNIIIDTLNKYGYQAMTGTNPDNLPVSLDILAYWVHIQNIGPFYEEFLFDSPPSYTTNHDNLIFNNNSQYTAVENSIREDAIPILV